ncbi:MAG: putative transrane transcriptional regulator (anti-sigma factor) [Acidobacteria bacterium]|nr:putative transrane transcriptional regulator (anti-sigma factor) [Acidobacteriota bacterium]
MHPNDTTSNDYVDGTLGPDARAEIDRHLAACAPCRQLVEDLRDILAATRGLDVREPPVRAWSRLERAIALEPHGATDRVASRPIAGTGARSTWMIGLAAAAALLLATVVGLRYAPPRQGAGAAATAATAPGATVDTGQAVQSIETELRQAESHYENAIKGLEAIANTEQSDLDPRTAATLQKNLAVIDQAISESRAAVRSQPASEPAQQSLIDGFKTKIGLLQDTVALINEMRKGNDAGAARIVSGLKQKGT